MSEFSPTNTPTIPSHDRIDRRTDAEKVFGVGYRVHGVTGLPLERGTHALPDDMQALRCHVPAIRETQGVAAADAMMAKLEKFIAAKKVAGQKEK